MDTGDVFFILSSFIWLHHPWVYIVYFLINSEQVLFVSTDH